VRVTSWSPERKDRLRKQILMMISVVEAELDDMDEAHEKQIRRVDMAADM
jgi:hypothetical protein